MVVVSSIVSFYFMEVEQPLDFYSVFHLPTSAAYTVDACVGDLRKTYKIGISTSLTYTELVTMLNVTMTGYTLTFRKSLGLRFPYRMYVTSTLNMSLFSLYPGIFNMMYPMSEGWVVLEATY